MTQDFRRRIAVFIDDDPDVRAANAQNAWSWPVLKCVSSRAPAAIWSNSTDISRRGHQRPAAMPDADGRALFQELRRRDPDIPVILITGQSGIHEAVELIPRRRLRLHRQTFSGRTVGVRAVHRVLERATPVLDNRRLREELPRREDDELPLVIGDSPVMVGLRASPASAGSNRRGCF